MIMLRAWGGANQAPFLAVHSAEKEKKSKQIYISVRA
jgi:hypothetical protein